MTDTIVPDKNSAPTASSTKIVPNAELMLLLADADRSSAENPDAIEITMAYVNPSVIATCSGPSPITASAAASGA